MLSEVQCTRVWEQMLGAEIRANYFADLTNRLYARQRNAIWTTLVLSSGAAAALLASLPTRYVLLRPILSLSTAAVSAYSVVQQNQKFALDAADLHARWLNIAKEYESIWENVYAKDAQVRLAEIDEHAQQASKAGSGFAYDRKRMLKWEEHVVAHRLAHA